LWADLNRKNEGFTQTETPVFVPKLDMHIESITYNGVVNIKFNQNVTIPEFIDLNDTEEVNVPHGRSVLALSEIDVARDMIDFSFTLNSDEDIENLEYYLELQEWKSRTMKILLNFTNPSMISKGMKPD